MEIDYINILKKDILKNFLALILLQATNFIIPLITFPYLIRTIGLEKFGVVSYGLTIFTYLIIVVDYGFNFSATRQVILNKNDTIALSNLFKNVMTTKLVLFTLCTLTIVLFCSLVDRFKQESTTYLIGILYVFGNILTPIWFFQGLEKMKYITISNVLGKIIQLLLLFIFVRDKKDYAIILGLYGIANVTSGIFSIMLAVVKYKLTIQLADIAGIWGQLSEGWYLFSSNLATTITNNSTIIFLGFFVSNIKIGYYSIAEKIVFVAWTMLGIFSQAIYPFVCRLVTGSYGQLYRFVWVVTIPVILLTGFGCLLIYIFADEFIRLIIGNSNVYTAYMLRSIIIVPFIVSLNIPAYQILLAYDYRKEYAKVFNSCALINLLLSLVLIYSWGIIGAIACMIIVQTIVTISLHILLSLKSKNLV